MRKKVIVLFAFVLFSMNIISGASSEYVAEINKAFTCLDSRVSSSSLTLEEAVFAGLANTPNSKINLTINQMKSPTEDCWPSSGCTLKDTAQVGLYKIKQKQNVTGIIRWLESRAATAEGLDWYLQVVIENNGPASCTINYDNVDHNIAVDSQMFLSGNPGSCLSFTNPSYRMKISQTCLEKEFSIKCDQGFKTNLLYQKSNEGTLYVSPDTRGASANAWTVEKINAKCFKTGNTCDYEGSLWAATAVYASGGKISSYAPYLRSLAFENKKYFPSAFIVTILEGREAHYSEIMNSQTVRPEGAYWQMVSTPYNKYYDTALGMLALGGADSTSIESSNTLGFLFENQDENGCWDGGNIRDTAFIIYAAQWMRSTYIQPRCGDGVRNGGEACDGTDLGTANCSSQNGYTGGSLSCIPAGQLNECTFNISQCTPVIPQVCGDGNITLPEVCDCGPDGNCTLAELGNNNCISRNYTRGNLSCSNDCRSFNVNQCIAGGSINPPGGGNNSNNNSNSSGNGPYTPNTLTDCELNDLFCVPSESTCREAGGVFYSDAIYVCNGLEKCCTVEVEMPTCTSLTGTVCPYTQACTGSPIESRDGPCCVTPYACSAPQNECDSNSDCVSGEVCISGSCETGVKSECSVNSDCNSDEECISGNCIEKTGGNSTLWIWIVLLLILIALVVLAIVYRDRIRVWWMRRTGKVSSSKIGMNGPPPGTIMGRRPPPRFGPPGMGMPPSRPVMVGPPKSAPAMQRAPQQNPVENTGSKNKEDEETLRKLKEMSK